MNSPEYLKKIKDKLYSAVVCDALDSIGFRNQSPRIDFSPYTGITKMVGRCKNTLWEDIYHDDPDPYALELQAVDSCNSGDIIIAAASGSIRSGIWGELLTTAALNKGCTGALIHGAVRDIKKMREMNFPVFASVRCIYDSLNRQRVVDMDIPVEIDGVIFSPGDLIICDEDGVVVIPREVEHEVIKAAFKKVAAENAVRDEIKKGMKATEAFKKYGVL
jgi:4-hydroxy-4-methyl-2-oxoglutarate aldolase